MSLWRAEGSMSGMAPLRALTVVLLAVSCAAPVTSTSPPSATATPGPAATTAAAVPTLTAPATATPLPPARPGLLTRNGDQPIVLRTETDTTPVRTVPSFQFATDGTRLTYWNESPRGAELHVLEIAGADRVVATFAGRRPGGIAWSTDETGLLVSLAEQGDPRFLIPRILVAVEIGSGATREIYRGAGPSGASVIPLAWRRSPEVFAAYETGPGGYNFGYTVIRPGQAAVRTDPDGQVIAMAPSRDGSFVTGQWLFEGTGVLKVWPVDDFSKKTELKLPAGEYLSQPRWWPDRQQIVFGAGRLADGVWRDVRFERWDPASGSRTVLRRLPDGAQLNYLIRADGSGLLTQNGSPPGAWEVTDLRTGATMPVPHLPGENILFTVLLR